MTTDAEKMILIERLDRAIESKNRMVQRAKDDSMLYVHAAETGAVAGIIGYYEGRTGKQNLIDGIPLDFAVMAAGFGVGFFGLAPKQATHAYAVGSGALAVYAYKWGREMGQRMSQPAPAATAGALPAAHGGGLTDAELSRLVQASRQL